MKLVGVGIGPGDSQLMTYKAVFMINEAKYVFVPESKGKSLAYEIAKPYLIDKEVIFLETPMGQDNKERYKDYAKKIFEMTGDDISVFLTLGDSSVYSTFTYISKEFKKLGGEVEFIPGITSFSAAASVLNIPLIEKGEKMIVCDSLDGVNLINIDTVVILKTVEKEKLIERLEKEGFYYYYVKRCTQLGEEIIRDKEKILDDRDYLSLIVAKRSEEDWFTL